MKKHLTIVIKLGTSSIVDEKTHEPLLPILSLIVDTAVKLQHAGHKVIIVSSGAIGVGMQRMEAQDMKFDKRPKQLDKLQALAAIGQCRLMSLWDQLFSHYRQPVAQVLLTRNDIADRTQYLNAQKTFFQLLEYGVIPIVNENDTLAVTEIKFGDNDTLSAITAGMVHADYLFLMTDVECLYDKNPRSNPDAKPIQVVSDIDSLEADVSSRGSSLGTGGMFTKIVAARRATSVGVTTIITISSLPGNIRNIIEGIEHPSDDIKVPLHTRFLPAENPIRDRHFWLLHIYSPSGNIYIDENAHKALTDKANLFPSGILDVEGTFAQQEAVRIFVVKRSTLPSTHALKESPSTPNGTSSIHTPTTPHYEKSDPAPVEVGRAIVNYSSTEIKRIRGLQATEISGILGYADSEYIAFRENIALLKAEKSGSSTPIVEAVREQLTLGGI
ncbi:glutamate 5-kinase [Microthyrium microscopicum]|uniref:Glutamate 5-kinase n=1 Tax=Microthyrium microscopicum TaxID=703497 RepID=A0A6A6TTU5_9PEZI|nr:glutamate 5-kinase [Microthyrium microscopicum]